MEREVEIRLEVIVIKLKEAITQIANKTDISQYQLNLFNVVGNEINDLIYLIRLINNEREIEKFRQYDKGFQRGIEEMQRKYDYPRSLKSIRENDPELARRLCIEKSNIIDNI